MIRLEQNTFYLFLALAFVAGAVLTYLFFGGKKEGMRAVESQPPPPARQDTLVENTIPALVFFHATWCPHCTHMAPVWEEVKKIVGTGASVVLKSVESAEPEMKNHTVPGFPTIRLFPKGLAHPNEFEDYKGERSTEGILTFLKQHVGG